MKKLPNGIISHKFSGTIKCYAFSKLAKILTHLHLNAETGHGILSELGYVGSFIVVAEMGGFLDMELEAYSEYIIKSISEKEKTFEDLYKGYVIKDGEFYIGINGGSPISKSNAKRFMKKEAVEFIKHLTSMKGVGRELVIEDAV